MVIVLTSYCWSHTYIFDIHDIRHCVLSWSFSDRDILRHRIFRHYKYFVFTANMYNYWWSFLFTIPGQLIFCLRVKYFSSSSLSCWDFYRPLYNISSWFTWSIHIQVTLTFNSYDNINYVSHVKDWKITYYSSSWDVICYSSVIYKSSWLPSRSCLMI